MCREKSLKWVDGKVKALGVWLCTDEKYNNKLYLNTVATELMCFYKYSKNVYISS